MIGTAATAVQQRFCVFGPAPKVNDFVPRLVDADHRGVDETTKVHVCEELAPVGERHPVVETKTRPFSLICEEETVVVKKKTESNQIDQPEFPVVLHCDAKVPPLCVSNLLPFFRADKGQAKSIFTAQKRVLS